MAGWPDAYINRIKIYLKKKLIASIIADIHQIILLNFLVLLHISASFLSTGQVCGLINMKYPPSKSNIAAIVNR
jgi:hypothetical protein